MNICVDPFVPFPSTIVLSPIQEGDANFTYTSNSTTSGYLRLYRNNVYIKSYSVTALFGGSASLPFPQAPVKGEVYSVSLWATQYYEGVRSKFVTVTGTSVSSCGPVFTESLFQKYFDCDDSEVEGWYENVVGKLMNGIVPEFVSRESEDYRDFWAGVSRFFGYYVKLSRMFSSLQLSRELLMEFLLERNLFLKESETLQELQDLRLSYYAYINNRGTIVQLTDRTQSEVFKLIHQYSFDYFHWNLFRENEMGWVMGTASPMFRGLGANKGLNMFPYLSSNDQEGFDLLPNIPIFNKGATSIITDEGYQVLRIGNTGGIFVSGPPSSFDQPYMIPISDSVDYEISFMVKLQGDAKLLFGVQLYSQEDISVPSYSSDTRSINITFLSDVTLQRKDKYVFVRGILYNSKKQPRTGDTTNIKQGTNLISGPETIGMTPVIRMSLDSGKQGSMLLRRVKITPLQTPFSRGFVQTRNLLSLWFKNRSTLSQEELEESIVQFLMPYNIHLKTIEGNQGGTTSEEDCNCNQTPTWVDTGETKCIGRDSYKSQKDTNKCTDLGIRWVQLVVNDTVNCPDCRPDGEFSHSVNEEADCSAPFVSYGKRFSRKETVFVHDGLCGFRPSSVTYRDECTGDTCTNRANDAIWSLEGGLFCEDEPCSNGSVPLYKKTGKIICSEQTTTTTQPVVIYEPLFRETVCIELDSSTTVPITTTTTTTVPVTTSTTTQPGCLLGISSITSPFPDNLPVKSLNLSGVKSGLRSYFLRFKLASSGQIVSQRDVDNITVDYLLFTVGADKIDKLSYGTNYIVEVYDKALPSCIASIPFFESVAVTTTTTSLTCSLAIGAFSNPTPSDTDLWRVELIGVISGTRSYNITWRRSSDNVIITTRVASNVSDSYLLFRMNNDGLQQGVAYKLEVYDVLNGTCIATSPFYTGTVTTTSTTTQPVTTTNPGGCTKPSGLQAQVLGTRGGNPYSSPQDACNDGCNNSPAYSDYYATSLNIGGSVYISGNDQPTNCYRPKNGWYLSSTNVVKIVDGVVVEIASHCFCNEVPQLFPYTVDKSSGTLFFLSILYSCTTVGFRIYKNGVLMGSKGIGEHEFSFTDTQVNVGDVLTARTNCGNFESGDSNPCIITGPGTTTTTTTQPVVPAQDGVYMLSIYGGKYQLFRYNPLTNTPTYLVEFAEQMKDIAIDNHNIYALSPYGDKLYVYNLGSFDPFYCDLYPYRIINTTFSDAKAGDGLEIIGNSKVIMGNGSGTGIYSLDWSSGVGMTKTLMFNLPGGTINGNIVKTVEGTLILIYSYLDLNDSGSMILQGELAEFSMSGTLIRSRKLASVNNTFSGIFTYLGQLYVTERSGTVTKVYTVNRTTFQILQVATIPNMLVVGTAQRQNFG